MNSKYRASFLVFFLFLFYFLDAQVITTVAGNGISTYNGDGGLAINASMSEPEGVAVDAKGNLYIVDEDNNVIRKVDTAGIITTIAGTGAIGYTGNGGAATAATLSAPAGICLDKKGNIYIADTWNHAIRKIDTAGIITTCAGKGISGFGGDNGQATLAFLSLPEGVAVDLAGNLYINDSGNNRVRKVDTSGVITTIAGTGAAGYGGDGAAATAAILNYPAGIAIDTATGNIYVADENNNRIRCIDTAGVITTFAGTGAAGYSGEGGLATAAMLSAAEGVSIDSAGNVYISDSGNSRVRRVDTSGVITAYAGNGIAGFSGDGWPAIAAELFTPKGIAVDRTGNLFIAEYFNSRVRKVSFCAMPISLSISGADTICAGDSTVLYVTGASNYRWNAAADSALLDSVVVKPLVTTTYSVEGVNGPCGAVDSFVVVVQNCSTGKMNFGKMLTVYPNPVTNVLYVNSITGLRIEVFDMLGVKRKEVDSTSEIDLSDLDSGSYYLRITDGRHSYRKIILKQ